MSTKLRLIPEETFDSTSFAIGDASIYQFAPANVSFEVTPPLPYSKINVPFTPRVKNIFYSYNIGVCDDSCAVDLPDGPYTVKYSVEPNSINTTTRSWYRITKIKAKYERIFLAVDIMCPCNGHTKNKLKNELRDIEIIIEGCLAAANNEDLATAEALYNKANSLLDNIKPCDC